MIVCWDLRERWMQLQAHVRDKLQPWRKQTKWYIITMTTSIMNSKEKLWPYRVHAFVGRWSGAFPSSGVRKSVAFCSEDSKRSTWTTIKFRKMCQEKIIKKLLKSQVSIMQIWSTQVPEWRLKISPCIVYADTTQKPTDCKLTL